MDILAEIVDHKLEEIASRSSSYWKAALATRDTALVPRRSLFEALRAAPGSLGLIAEIKRRSPSKPVIRAQCNPAELARSYAAAGASALSVLTDERYFGGSLDDLSVARQACEIPVLRKDFIVDERQLGESKRAGADAVLLIAACLGEMELARMHSAAKEWDLEVLVEVHDEREFDRALGLPAALIGINNRDLSTFKVDISTTLRLMKRWAALPECERPLVVSESGIGSSPLDLALLVRAGCRGMLVGESLLSAPDVEFAARQLLDCAPAPLPVGGVASAPPASGTDCLDAPEHAYGE